MRFLVLIAVGIVFPIQAQVRAQVEAKNLPGLSVQIYPAGQIVQARMLVHHGAQTDLRFYVGINRARRKDFGKKDLEEGFGGGVGLDLVHLRGSNPSGFYLGGKLDLWYLDIDWEHIDNRCPPGAQCLVPEILRRGETKIFVIQPTATLGYRYAAEELPVALEFSLALGAEINAYTDGDQVGEGLILLAGVAIDF